MDVITKYFESTYQLIDRIDDPLLELLFFLHTTSQTKPKWGEEGFASCYSRRLYRLVFLSLVGDVP